MIHDTGYRIQNTENRIHDTGYRIHDTGCRIQDTRYKIDLSWYWGFKYLFKLYHFSLIKSLKRIVDSV